MSVYETLEKTETNDARLFVIPDELRNKMVLYSVHALGGKDSGSTVSDLYVHLNSRAMADVLGLKENQKIKDFGKLLINRHVFKLTGEKVVEKRKETVGGRDVNVYYPVDADDKKTQMLGEDIKKMWKEEEEKSLYLMNLPFCP
jgi:hypothetical protein